MSVLLISTIAMDSLKYVRTCTVTFSVYVRRASWETDEACAKVSVEKFD